MIDKTLLSEEILNEILGNVSKIYDIKIVNSCVIWNNGYVNEINIYELMHLAKVKLLEYGYSLEVFNPDKNCFEVSVKQYIKGQGEWVEYFEDHGKTEPEAVLKAFKYALDNK